MKQNPVRLDHKVISEIIGPGAKVLDLGCGDGTLLAFLSRQKNVKAQGIEINEDAIYKCVEKGVSVFHDDFESGLKGYPDNSFDYVILNQSMQEAKNLIYVLERALAVGKNVIVGFPNFAHIRARLRLFFRGKTPITASLPYRWYDTPNLHFLSLWDFIDFCRDKNIRILKKYFLGDKKIVSLFPNLFALNGIFLLTVKP